MITVVYCKLIFKIISLYIIILSLLKDNKYGRRNSRNSGERINQAQQDEDQY